MEGKSALKMLSVWITNVSVKRVSMAMDMKSVYVSKKKNNLGYKSMSDGLY